jgi:hypothetical protein
MTPTFYRAYREANRIAGISLHENKHLLLKVLPDPDEIPSSPAIQQCAAKKEPWIWNLLGFLAVYGFFVWALVEAIWNATGKK